MGFSREHLSQDEVIVADLRPHWWFVAPQSAALVVAVLLGLIALVNDWPQFIKVVSGLAVLAALGWFGSRYATWVTTNFVITNERIISQGGVISKRGIEIPLDRINTVFFGQTLFERMIGAGDIGIESAGEGGRQTFADIRKPAVVQQEIYRQKEAYEQRRIAAMGRQFADSSGAGVASGGPPPPAPAPVDIPAQIEKLDQLRRSGALTEAEFQAKKDELLKRL
jgi:uncharacterized membrane protein YdbT with pleckstrin-like domain